MSALERRTRDDVEIDLGQFTFVLPTAMLVLAARITDELLKARRTVKVRVPRTWATRDALKLYTFFEGLAGLTAVPVGQLVHSEDHWFLNEPQITYSPLLVSVPSRVGLSRRDTVPKFFHGLKGYRFSESGDSIAMVETECKRWRDLDVIHVLEQHLKGPAADVSRVQIHELAANSVQHPRAGAVASISDFQGLVTGGAPGAAQGARYLTLAIWDNGESIITTLRRAADRGAIRVTKTAVPDRFSIKATGWLPEQTQRNASETPDDQWQDAELLLASLFPGVTQRGVREVVHVPRTEHVEWENQPGFGLHALYRSCIEAFGGTVAIRTKRCFLNLKRRPRSAARFDYQARLIDGLVPFPGNMITVRLPVRGPRSRR